MAKTKRTVEEAEVAVESTVESAAAAASSASKLITQSKLSYFATEFWKRVKRRYDGTFKSARLSESNSNDKKLIFTKTDNGIHEVELTDYVRIQDKNDFKQDVSSNVGMTDGTLKLGTISSGSENIRRFSGHRSITTKQFVDNYVSYLSVLADDSLAAESNSSWTVWAVEKKPNRADDRVIRQYERRTVPVKEMTIGSNTYKYVDLTIEEKFENEVYFIVGFEDTTKGYRVINLKPEYQNDDAVNVSTRPTVNGTIGWEPTVKNNVAVMVIYGRESIGSLSEKIKKLSPDSGLYVKQEETTNTGGTAEKANKVVRLGNNGKLDKDMLPSIAINEYFPVTEFTHQILQRLDHFENGDVVVVTGENPDKGKRFLCVDKEHNTDNFIKGFVELNSKDGIVKSVNGKIGEVVLDLVSTENSLKLTIGNGAGDAVEKIVPIVTDTEIDAIINGLTD